MYPRNTHLYTSTIFFILFFAVLLSPSLLFAQTVRYSGTCIDSVDNDNDGRRDAQDPTCNESYGFCEVMTETCRRQVSAIASSNARQRFNPSATIQGSGRTFGGVQFSGVGGALASCLDVGGSVVRGISSVASDLFKNTAKEKLVEEAKKSALSAVTEATGALEKIPVEDSKLAEETKKANQRESCLNGVAYAIAKSLLQQVTNKTLSWVNTGFNGNPLYVRDIDSYLKTVSDEKINQYLNRIPNQNPIFGNAIRSIVTQQVGGIQDGLISKTMNTPQAQAYENFQNNFTNGGWRAFLDPRNDAVGSLLETAEDIGDDVGTVQQNVIDQLNRNSNFLNLTRCVEYEDVAEAQAYLDRCQGVTDDGVGNENYEYAGCGHTQLQIMQQRINNPACLKTETVTPGSVIAAQTTAVTTSAIRQLEQADEINEVLGSFFDQMLNRLISDGLSSVRGKSSIPFSYSGAGANVVIGTNGQPIGAGSSAVIGALGYRSARGGYEVTEFDMTRPQELRAILQTQYDYLSRLKDARQAVDRIVPTLGALDYCVPGPNPTWPDGFAGNVDIFFENLQEVTKESSLGRKLLQSIPIIGALFGGEPKPDTIAVSDLLLYDKASGAGQNVGDRAFHRKRREGFELAEKIQNAYDNLVTDYNNHYTPQKIVDAFVRVDSDPVFAKATIEDILAETSNLPGYGLGIVEIENEYNPAEIGVINAINELEDIRQEANEIVSIAKARYIREQELAGTPVNLECINSAYVIDTTPIIPVARQEGDAVSPFYERSNNATINFYNTLRL